jgi:hypothetical protein
VAVVLQVDKGLTVSIDGMAVVPGNGINVSAAGVAGTPSTGIVFDDKGVSIVATQLLVKGMIMMFSGAATPGGWAMCDGTNGTPDLRNRFVLGGVTAADLDEKKSVGITGVKK